MKKTNISTWKNWSCFSRLQKKGCFSTCFADGRFWGSMAIIFSINSRAMTSSAKEEIDTQLVMTSLKLQANKYPKP